MLPLTAVDPINGKQRTHRLKYNNTMICKMQQFFITFFGIIHKRFLYNQKPLYWCNKEYRSYPKAYSTPFRQNPNHRLYPSHSYEFTAKLKNFVFLFNKAYCRLKGIHIALQIKIIAARNGTSKLNSGCFCNYICNLSIIVYSPTGICKANYIVSAKLGKDLKDFACPVQPDV